MKRFINNDITVVKDNCVISKSQKELESAIIDRARSVIKTRPANEQHEFVNRVNNGGCDEMFRQSVKVILNFDEDIRNDISVRQTTLVCGLTKQDTIVNVVKSCGGSPIVGYNNLNGVAFIGIMIHTAGVGKQFFTMLYMDDTGLRAYTPLRGNKVNIDFLCALGDEPIYDNFDTTDIEAAYAHIGVDLPGMAWFTNGDHRKWAEMYALKYGYKNAQQLPFNWIEIQKDIVSKFNVSNTVIL